MMMVVELVFWLGWALPTAILLTRGMAAWSLLPPAAFALAWAWWRAALPSDPVLGAAALAALLLLGWQLRLSRSRRTMRALERLQAAEAAWWRAMRAHTSNRAGFCERLRAYALAVWECAQALAELDSIGVQATLSAPPQPPELRPEAGRPGPRWLWEQFDNRHRAASQRTSLNPAGDCATLAQVTIELLERIERGEPALPAHIDGIAGDEFTGAEAAMVHVLCAPSLAAMTAAHLAGEQSATAQVDLAALGEHTDRAGTDSQRTLFALALLLGGCGDEPVGVGDLLELQDTDLAHALEATALKRGLRRVYPSQRPDSLWLRAALAEGPR